jgi:WD40 repeat protein
MIKCWSANGKGLIKQISALKGGVSQMIILKNSPILVARRDKGDVLFFWNLKTGQHFTKTLAGSFQIKNLCPTRDGQFALTTWSDVQIWDGHGRALDTLPLPYNGGATHCLAWNHKYQELYAGVASFQGSGLFKFQHHKWVPIEGASEVVFSLSWSKDQEHLAIGSQILNDLESGLCVWSKPQNSFQKFMFQVTDRAGTSIFYDLDFSPDGRFLAVAVGSKAHVFEVENYQEISSFGDQASVGAYTVRFSEDGKILYVGTAKGYAYAQTILYN